MAQSRQMASSQVSQKYFRTWEFNKVSPQNINFTIQGPERLTKSSAVKVYLKNCFFNLNTLLRIYLNLYEGFVNLGPDA